MTSSREKSNISQREKTQNNTTTGQKNQEKTMNEPAAAEKQDLTRENFEQNELTESG